MGCCYLFSPTVLAMFNVNVCSGLQWFKLGHLGLGAFKFPFSVGTIRSKPNCCENVSRNVKFSLACSYIDKIILNLSVLFKRLAFSKSISTDHPWILSSELTAHRLLITQACFVSMAISRGLTIFLKQMSFGLVFYLNKQKRY